MTGWLDFCKIYLKGALEALSEPAWEVKGTKDKYYVYFVFRKGDFERRTIDYQIDKLLENVQEILCQEARTIVDLYNKYGKTSKEE